MLNGVEHYSGHAAAVEGMLLNSGLTVKREGKIVVASNGKRTVKYAYDLAKIHFPATTLRAARWEQVRGSAERVAEIIREALL